MTGKTKPLYRRPAPKRPGHVTRDKWQVTGKAKSVGRESSRAENNIGHPVSSASFELREDGSIATPSTLNAQLSTLPRLAFSNPSRGIWLYHGNCLELLDAIAAKYPEGRFDAIFADPPYFLSNGGITCHAGKMVKVDKGDWDVGK